MILGQISYLDCIVFLICLAPQLLLRVGLLSTLTCGIKALPFLLIRLPIGFIHDHLLISKQRQTPFVQRATLFQDLVIRCVRYAFSDIPPNIGRVFFSKWVSLPFFKFRMLRHGYIHSPVSWDEVDENGARGLWITFDKERSPDIVLFYCHGGGFSMGSGYFYLEFLVVWLTLLRKKGFQNPAIFALEYTLVPNAIYPTQLQEAVAGYDFALSKVADSKHICVGGDSAGGTLVLSLLLYIASKKDGSSRRPGYATLISPWTHLVLSKNCNTPSDYLSSDTLHKFGRLFAGSEMSLQDPLVSPGTCQNEDWWGKALPSQGVLLWFGADELLAPGIIDLLQDFRKSRDSSDIEVNMKEGGIHAWPVAEVFLCESQAERTESLQYITDAMSSHLPK